MIDITQLVTAIIGILAVVLSAYALPWLKTKVGESRYATIVQAARVAANAAEQLFKGTGRGTEKLEYALDFAKTSLAKHNIVYDEKVIRAAIEAAVQEIKP